MICLVEEILDFGSALFEPASSTEVFCACGSDVSLPVASAAPKANKACKQLC
jgi:hypothetical protein